jgi:hypothetical protein
MWTADGRARGTCPADSFMATDWRWIIRAGVRFRSRTMIETAWDRAKGSLESFTEGDWSALVPAVRNARWKNTGDPDAVSAPGGAQTPGVEPSVREVDGAAPRPLAHLETAPVAEEMDPEAVDGWRTALLRSIWEHSAPHRKRFSISAWTAFVLYAGELRDPDFLRELFRELVAHHDPARHFNWGDLEDPLLRAAATFGDSELQSEIRETVRGQRLDFEWAVEILGTVAPAGRSRPEGRFEGACRCLMRHLVTSWIFTPGQFEDVLRRTVEAIAPLSQDRRDNAWVHLLGRGQEAYLASVRTLYTEALLRESRIGSTPFERMKHQELQAIFEDLIDPGSAGLVQRLGRFVRKRGGDFMSLPAAPSAGAAAEPIVEFLVESINSTRWELMQARSNRDAFLGHLYDLVDAIPSEHRTAERLLGLIQATIVESASAVYHIAAVELSEQAHDLAKTLSREKVERLNEASMSEYAKLAALEEVVDAVQGFELDVRAIGECSPTRNPLNLTGLLRTRFGTHHLDGRIAELQIPTRCYILAPQGAREEHLVPLFRAIRQNAECALAALPPEQRWFRCEACDKDGWVRVTIENTYLPGATPGVPSSGFGLSLIRHRIVDKLGGEMVYPPRRDLSRDPPVWQLEFRLPAAPPGTVLPVQVGTEAAEPPIPHEKNGGNGDYL